MKAATDPVVVVDSNNIQPFFFEPDQFPMDHVMRHLIGPTQQSGRLTHLHLITQYELFKRKNDQSTIWHRYFYEALKTQNESETERNADNLLTRDFFRLYRAFIKSICQQKFPFEKSVVYQRIPNLRIQLPGNVGVGEFHRDGDYGHNSEELNVFLPLTPAMNTNTIWTETTPGAEDYIPLEVETYGKAYIWRGVKLKHGNKTSKEYWTRVSLDFRIIPGSKYLAQAGTSINTGMKFIIGDYYLEMEL